MLSRRALAALVLVVAVGVAALAPDHGVAQQARLAEENSWLRVQNVGTQPATLDLTFYNRDGSQAAKDGCPKAGVCDAISPGSGRSFFQQTLDALPKGYRGSGYLVGDQPFVAMLARDLIRPDGTLQLGGDSLRLGAGTDRHFLPWVANTSALVSRITIENTSKDTPACVQIQYFASGGLSATAVDPSGTQGSCPSGGEFLAPRASMVRDETSMNAPFGFDGAAIVRTQQTSGGVAASVQQISVAVDTRDRVRAGLSTYRALSSDETSRVVLLPMIDRNTEEAGASYTTRFRIFSATPGAPNEVTLRFEGRDGAGGQVSIESKVTVFGSMTCDQSQATTLGCLPADRALPATFTGSVRIQAVEPITVVVQRLSTSGSLSDYRGFTPGEASRQVVLPVINKNYGPFGGRNGWNSSFRVASFDGSTTYAYIVYYSKQFPRGLFPDSPVPVEGSRTFRPTDERKLPDNWVGSVVIVSDRPVVVVADLRSDVFEGDPEMLYNGVSLE
ncbi:MAG: hypothetical protein EPO65_05390 [Dehalococcoidia bacterium]|nr:MAG: hypothetical protein EPO65_05390 [Dehalococcoidia bacterium]